jgi:hypothetical protein
MMARASGTLALASLGFLLAGCGRPASPRAAAEGPVPAGAARLTLHVKDMTKRLNIG